MSLLEDYAQVTGSDVIAHLGQLAAPFSGARVVHINSTRIGGRCRNSNQIDTAHARAGY